MQGHQRYVPAQAFSTDQLDLLDRLCTLLYNSCTTTLFPNVCSVDNPTTQVDGYIEVVDYKVFFEV